MKSEYVECACGTMDHTLRFVSDEDFDGVYVHYFLENESFLKRILLGFKYIFGFKSRYGHFGETFIKSENIPALISFLQQHND